MSKIYIVAANRTAIGGFGGSLAKFTAPQLGSLAIRGALNKLTMEVEVIDECIFGNVMSANVGQNPARQALLFSQLPNTIPCTTVNKVCSSGMKALMFGAAMIRTGESNVVISGGMESMSNVPFYSPKHRWGSKYGHSELVDGIVKDGLWDVYNKYLMGVAGELCASKYAISREEQDDFALSSYEKSQNATTKGFFASEIIPVEIQGAKGKPAKIVSKDDECFNVS